MVQVTKRLLQETNACIGYAQANEILLVLLVKSSYTYCEMHGYSYEKRDSLEVTLSRVASLATLTYARLRPPPPLSANGIVASTSPVVLFEARSRVAIDQNSVVQDLAQKEQEAMAKKTPGTFVVKRTEKKLLSQEEFAKLPAKHTAKKKYPNFNEILERLSREVTRKVVVALAIPSFEALVNKLEVVFAGEPPIITPEDFLTVHGKTPEEFLKGWQDGT